VPFEDLQNHPYINSMYEDGTLRYNITVPVKGTPLIPVFLGNITINAAEAIMEAKRVEFNLHQEESVLKPATWVNVGYVVDAAGLTAYFQYQMPEHAYAPAQWNNWPTTPPVQTDVP
jgi:hypothetical protein